MTSNHGATGPICAALVHMAHQARGGLAMAATRVEVRATSPVVCGAPEAKLSTSVRHFRSGVLSGCGRVVFQPVAGPWTRAAE